MSRDVCVAEEDVDGREGERRNREQAIPLNRVSYNRSMVVIEENCELLSPGTCRHNTNSYSPHDSHVAQTRRVTTLAASASFQSLSHQFLLSPASRQDGFQSDASR